MAVFVKKIKCPFSNLDKLETPFHIFLFLNFLLPILFILAHELIFPAYESVNVVMLSYLSASSDISANKKYQEGTGVWSHKNGPIFIYNM